MADGGQSEAVLVKMHPDMKKHLQRQAREHYCSVPEYVRRLIHADMNGRRSSS